MPRALMALLLAVLTLSMSAGPVAANDDDSSATQDRAYGSGQYVGVDLTFDFDARSDPLGGNAQGTYRFETTSGALVFAGNVNCLKVAGNRATIAGPITEAGADYSNLVGWIATFNVEDNGPNGQGDRISNLIVVPEGHPVACEPRLSGFQIQNGDIVVQDAQCDKFKDRPEADKDKCKIKEDDVSSSPVGTNDEGGAIVVRP